MYVSFDLFEIPVYRTTHEAYLKQQSKLRNKAINPIKIFDEYELATIWEPMPEASKLEFIRNWENSFNASDDARIWKYNEIVGFICLIVTPGVIKGEYYLTEAKRLRRDRGRIPYKYQDKVVEIGIFQRDTQEEISNKILQRLKDLQKTSRFENRYIYLDTFAKLIDFIDWKKLIPTVV